ncbi:MAG: PadR family transcriptional regulator [Lachnospiraceae bacterium]
MAMEKGLLSGSTGMLLLKLLSEKDMYGYEMIETLRGRSNQVFELKAGTLYPLLHSLEAGHYLVSYEQEALGKMRKYYSITKEGRTYLKKKEKEWETYSQAVIQVLGGVSFGI